MVSVPEPFAGLPYARQGFAGKPTSVDPLVAVGWNMRQGEIDELRAANERLLLALYEIERMPFGFEAEVHAMALAALEQANQ